MSGLELSSEVCSCHSMKFCDFLKTVGTRTVKGEERRGKNVPCKDAVCSFTHERMEAGRLQATFVPNTLLLSPKSLVTKAGIPVSHGGKKPLPEGR